MAKNESDEKGTCKRHGKRRVAEVRRHDDPAATLAQEDHA